jgi:hypothetical protein
VAPPLAPMDPLCTLMDPMDSAPGRLPLDAVADQRGRFRSLSGQGCNRVGLGWDYRVVRQGARVGLESTTKH